MEDNFDYSTLTKEEAVLLLNEAIQGQDKIILHPNLLSRLMSLGVEFTFDEGETLDQFFERAKVHAHKLGGDMPPLPQWLEYQFQTPYREARLCLLMGLYGSSITLSAVLLEHVLKWNAFCVESRKSQSVPADRWQKLEEESNFSNAINYARRWGLIDKDQLKQLHDFRDEIRNVQVHSMVRKATADTDFHKVNVANIATKTVEPDQVINATAMPAMAAMAKEKRDEDEAANIFKFVHSCIEHLFAKRLTLLRGTLKSEE